MAWIEMKEGTIADICLSGVLEIDVERLVQFTRAVIEDSEDSAGAAMYGLALSWGIVRVSDGVVSAEDIETRCARFALSDDIVRVE